MKLRVLFAAAMLAALLAPCLGTIALAAEETGYAVEVADQNNLAANKYDWITDKVGSAATKITADGMRLESFGKGGSPYAVYQTNKFNEFKYSMYAKLNLTRPSESGLAYDFDYSNLYISFMINADAPVAVYACPWNGGKAYFSLCFENLQGFDKTQLYLNEGWAGDGATRKVVAETDKVHWNDGQFHWFEFEFVNDEQEETYRGETRLFTGKTFRFYFDGELVLSYFQRDQNVFSNYLNKYVDEVDFSGTSGYLGLWPSSDFPVGADTSETDCYVEIRKLQITSLDDGNTAPFERAPAPDFDITSITYSPQASYEVGEPVEIRLSNLFEYEGEETISYTITSKGSALGGISNGYWTWTPEAAGTYYVDVKAEVGDKSAMNYLTLRVVESQAPVTDPPGGEEERAGCGCGSASSASALLLGGLAVAGVFLLKRGI